MEAFEDVPGSEEVRRVTKIVFLSGGFLGVEKA
jgi:hypothetical protein